MELTVILGAGSHYNSTYSAAEVGPRRAFYSATFNGLVRVSPSGG